MFEEILLHYLSKYLGNYIDGLNKDAFKVSIFSGNVELKKLTVKTDALKEFNLPIEIKSGYLGKLILKVPWKKITSKPTYVTIEDVYLVIVSNKEVVYDELKEREKLKEKRQRELELLENQEDAYNKDDDDDDDSDNGFLGKMASSIIAQLQVQINRIHIRFEDKSSDPKHPFACGILLNSLTIHSITDLKEVVLDVFKKSLDIDGFSFYFDSDINKFARTDKIHHFKSDLHSVFKKSPDALCISSYIVNPINLSLTLSYNAKDRNQRLYKPEDCVKFAIFHLHLNDKDPDIILASESWISAAEKEENEKDIYDLYKKKLHKKTNLSSKKYNKIFIRKLLFHQEALKYLNEPSPLVDIDITLSKINVTMKDDQYRDILTLLTHLIRAKDSTKYKRFAINCRPNNKENV